MRKFHTQKLEETKLHVDKDAEFKSKLHLTRLFVQLKLQVPQNQDFIAGELPDIYCES